jgi:hypothetical protein
MGTGTAEVRLARPSGTANLRVIFRRLLAAGSLLDRRQLGVA